MHYINHYNSPLEKLLLQATEKNLRDYGLTGKNILPLRLLKNMSKKICLFLNRQQNGLIFILAAKIPILRRLCFYRQLRFVMKFGKYF